MVIKTPDLKAIFHWIWTALYTNEIKYYQVQLLCTWGLFCIVNIKSYRIVVYKPLSSQLRPSDWLEQQIWYFQSKLSIYCQLLQPTCNDQNTVYYYWGYETRPEADVFSSIWFCLILRTLSVTCPILWKQYEKDIRSGHYTNY